MGKNDAELLKNNIEHGIMLWYKEWWHNIGSGIITKIETEDDYESHAHRISEACIRALIDGLKTMVDNGDMKIDYGTTKRLQNKLFDELEKLKEILRQP